MEALGHTVGAAKTGHLRRSSSLVGCEVGLDALHLKEKTHKCLAPAPSNDGSWAHTTWVRSRLSQDGANLVDHTFSVR